MKFSEITDTEYTQLARRLVEDYSIVNECFNRLPLMDKVEKQLRLFVKEVQELTDQGHEYERAKLAAFKTNKIYTEALVCGADIDWVDKDWLNDIYRVDMKMNLYRFIDAHILV